LATLCGCGGDADQAERVETVPVKGTVSVNGKTFTGPALLTLSPVDAEKPTTYGVITETGTFSLFTYGTREDPDGSPTGQYTVTLGTDDAGMSMTGVPVTESSSVEISQSDDGDTVQLEIKLIQKKGAGLQDGPNPNP